MRNSIPKVRKIVPELDEWLRQRQQNIQKMIGLPIKVTMMDTQRIIAQTSGVEITNEMIRRLKYKNVK